jgi:hypothetical protein
MNVSDINSDCGSITVACEQFSCLNGVNVQFQPDSKAKCSLVLWLYMILRLGHSRCINDSLLLRKMKQ